MEQVMIEKALEEHRGHQGTAAEALGISRRTLTRKIKAYQICVSGGRSAAGALSVEQFRYFRAALDEPVLLRSSAGVEGIVVSVNLSSSGIGVRQMLSLKFAGIVDIEFSLPGSAEKMKLKGRITWADSLGNAGIRFVSVPRSAQQSIDDWIAKKRAEEGWAKL